MKKSAPSKKTALKKAPVKHATRKAPVAKKLATKKARAVARQPITFKQYPCLFITQGLHQLVFFKVKAKELWELVEINQRDSDKDTGYQRVLSESRVAAVKKYIERGNSIPTSILIALNNQVELSTDQKEIRIPNISNAGWVIDGQHRLAGAKEADNDIELAIIGIMHPSEQEQIKQFVTINQESKNVPRSLYFDLLRHLPPNKSELDIARERAVDIANDLKKDENSPFFSKIVLANPQGGEMSLNNFVRKVAPLVGRNGFFRDYSLIEQTKIIENYFAAFKNVFPQYFSFETPIFLKTLGFGALINSLATIFQITLKNHQGFTVADIVKVIDNINDIDFTQWTSGTGTQAEKLASEDLLTQLQRRISDDGTNASSTLRL
jgi:DGQHR domain-containing protein